ncbi:Pkinase-domain-containing protein [Piedraia hortae CBS 480.64]|uniref:Pkinase-domain-containing protein n=1 Tax=Piedraia hortae CBS 480.64 TaxID=1314780 RepID=A0A6A7BSE3_9PEZI|nr:Pkinase-domain-containing protein [Piedraia hortae CBS 480.64]
MADLADRRFRGCTYITDYEITEKLGEGTFGVVSKARSRRTGALVALKKILMHNEKDGFPITALREIKLLKMLNHPNILRLDEMAVEPQTAEERCKYGRRRTTLSMAMPYVEHDLSGLLSNPEVKMSEGQIKCYMMQLLDGIAYLHESNILHRDMKAANLLISNSGKLQIADFGLARHYHGPTPQPGQGNGTATRPYTSLVVTRWYRPPELLLNLKHYTPAIDMWGIGCVLGEMFERKPILEGKTDVDQCFRIFQLVGSPTETNMPGWSSLPGCEGRKDWEPKQGDIDRRFGPHLGPQGLDLLRQLLLLDWRKRINAVDAMRHPYFSTEPLPLPPHRLPKYRDTHELDSRRRGQEKPLAPLQAHVGGAAGNEWNGYINGYPNPRDRGLPRGYDGRNRHQFPDNGRMPARRPDVRDSRPHHLLPPRPMDVQSRPENTQRGPPPSRGISNGDTYIPSYAIPHDRPRPPPDRNQAYSRRDGYRDDYRTYRDPDAPHRGSTHRRTRSRSPDRKSADNDIRRDRRDRDPYRRAPY